MLLYDLIMVASCREETWQAALAAVSATSRSFVRWMEVMRPGRKAALGRKRLELPGSSSSAAPSASYFHRLPFHNAAVIGYTKPIMEGSLHQNDVVLSRQAGGMISQPKVSCISGFCSR